MAFSVRSRSNAPQRYEFRSVEKFCVACGGRLKIVNTIQITRKKYCSKECVRGQRTEITLPAPVLASNRTNAPPSVEQIRELLDYDPLTGKMVWRVDVGVPAQGRGGFRCKGKEAGSRSHGYWRIKIEGILYDRALLAWVHYYGETPVGVVDHDDLNRGNDAINNLREATRSQNYANQCRRHTNKSGFKGVHLNRKTNRWQAEIVVRGKKFYLGRFDDPEQAASAYAIAAVEKQQEFARAV
jgi:hypothetical protein